MSALHAAAATVWDRALRHQAAGTFRSWIHGPDHWARVERNGLVLGASLAGADELVLRCFACLHDLARRDDGTAAQRRRYLQLMGDHSLARGAPRPGEALVPPGPTVAALRAWFARCWQPTLDLVGTWHRRQAERGTG